jgi:putative flippase GtrA
VEPPLDVRRAEGQLRVAAFVVNQLWLTLFLDWLGWGKIVAQMAAIVLVTPLNFLGNKLWSFRR